MASAEGGPGVPRWALRSAAAATLLLAIVAFASFPASAPLSGGWRTPIIAFELARQPADLAWLSGPAAEPLRQAMDAGHRVDRWFPLAYGGLLILSAWSMRARPAWLRWLGVVAGGVAIVTDWWENSVLIALTDALREGREEALAGLLGPLMVATWAKWGCIALALAAIGWGERQNARGRMGLGLALAALTLVAALSGAAWAGEAMALLTTLGFVGLMVRAVRTAA